MKSFYKNWTDNPNYNFDTFTIQNMINSVFCKNGYFIKHCHFISEVRSFEEANAVGADDLTGTMKTLWITMNDPG